MILRSLPGAAVSRPTMAAASLLPAVPAAASPETLVDFVALGDSYAAGTGSHRSPAGLPHS
ncbi:MULTISPECIES: hypothetical protein [Catenuloplanes]|uniref:Uncharacterized protein n=1 Tax=Catenuloplanes niger TaxID=587534 RepID=A0AAE3ZZ45_9ACTN|nr:hypothetical protein [Catenuloplanes niger]MDR7327590.1 hypothetical protein [Catenuloplanes niger]